MGLDSTSLAGNHHADDHHLCHYDGYNKCDPDCDGNYHISHANKQYNCDGSSVATGVRTIIVAIGITTVTVLVVVIVVMLVTVI